MSPHRVDGQSSVQNGDVPIAVVGYACRFPGDATSPQSFYEMLAKGQAAWSEVPPNRYNVDAFWHPSADRIGTTVSRGAHWMKQDPAVFDAPFFSMTSAEAAALDPQLRMLLEVVYECFENSGIPIQNVTGSDTSVFVGSSSSEYGSVQADDIENPPLYAAVGTGVSMLANRVSHFYDLQGTSVALNTACSSGLVSVHLGCQSLRTGESRMSLIAASQLMLCPDGPVCLSRLGFLSPDSRCYTFDDRANGYARGEGICVLACKRLDDALADGDTIRSVIRSSLSNQDGRTPGIVQPNPKAQASLIRAVYKSAGIDPHSTQYFEAHGTGTRLGDPIEVSALVDALNTKQRPENNPLFIGSVKTNIGHLEGCAGLAGLLKTILSVERGVIFPSLNFEKPNPRLLLDDWRLAVPKTLTPWPTKGLRRASVNSFGYGGSNAHCIIDDAFHYLESRGLKGNTTCCSDSILSLDGYPNNAANGHETNGSETNGSETNGSDTHGSDTTESDTNAHQTYKTGTNGSSLKHDLQSMPQLFVLSSPEQAAVERLARSHGDYLHAEIDQEAESAADKLNIEDLAYTLADRRSNFQWRVSFVANSAQSLLEQMRAPVKAIRASDNKKNSLLFIFTGQGAQHYAMGRELLQEPIFAASVKSADSFFSTELKAGWSVIEELKKTEDESRIHSAKFAQPLCTVLQIALVDLFRSWGITPAAVVGHSSGEITAAYAAQGLTAEDAWVIAYYRGLLSDQLPNLAPQYAGRMGMMAVGLSEEGIQKYLPKDPRPEGSQIVVACCNSSQSITLSGDRRALSSLEKDLVRDQVFTRALKVEVAYHSPYMQTIADRYSEALQRICPQTDIKSDVVMISSVTGYPVENKELGPSYWVKNMCSPVRFNRAIEYIFPADKAVARRQKTKQLSIRGILEFGPHSALLGPVRQILTQQGRKEEVFCDSVQVRGQDAYMTALKAVGDLWTRGYPVALPAVNRSEDSASRRVLGDLPSYPWNHSTPFWYESTASVRRLRAAPRHDFVGTPTDSAIEWKWRNFLRIKENPWLLDHQIQGAIQLSPTALLCTIIEAVRQVAQRRNDSIIGFELIDVEFPNPLLITDDGVEVYTELYPTGKLSEHRDSTSQFRFRIFAVAESSPEPYCTGTITLENKFVRSLPKNLRDVSKSSWSPQAPKEFYSDWSSKGIQWGPQYQLLQDIKTSSQAAVVKWQLADTRAAMPEQYEYEHLVHPTTLDACFQSIFAALPTHDKLYSLRRIKSLFVPMQISRAANTQFTANSRLEYQGFGSYMASMYAGEEGPEGLKFIAQDVQITCQKSDLDTVGLNKRAADISKMASNLYWKPDVDKLSPENLKALFYDSGLVLTRPAQQTGLASREQSIPQRQRFSVPDLVPWKAYAAKWLELFGHKSPDQVILEIASDTGDFTRKALDTLGGRDNGTPLCAKYICALKSADLRARSRADIGAWMPWKHFFELGDFDMFESTGNGPDPASIDNINISCDSIDSITTETLDRVLTNCSAALKIGGRLIFTQVNARRRGQLVHKELTAHGFMASPTILLHDPDNVNGPAMVVAVKSSTPALAVTKAVVALPANVSTDLEGFATALTQRLQQEGVEVERALWTDLPKSVVGKAIICLVEAETPLIYDLDDDLLGKVMTFMGTDKDNLNKGGIWITRGNCYLDPSGDPAYHASTGFIRVMRNEKQESRFSELSLSQKLPLNRKWAVDMATTVFKDVFEAESVEKVAETEVGELDGIPYIPRIYDEPFKNRGMDLLGKRLPAENISLLEEGKHRRLEIGNPEDLSSLRFVEVEPQDVMVRNDDDVVIDLRAHGVNSVNYMIESLDSREEQLGSDAAGYVAAVGPNVHHVKPGDRVAVFLPGAYSTRVRVHQYCLSKIPQSMSMEDAATLPSLLLSAYQIVIQSCRLNCRDSILVASAESSIGQVIMRVAQAANAKVFAITNNNTSRSALQIEYNLPKSQVFCIQDGNLVDLVLEQTNKRGVTFAINTNSRDQRMAEVVQRCASALGKVVEVRRETDSAESSTSQVQVFSIAAIQQMLRKDMEICQQLMTESRHLLEDGLIQPLSSCAVFPYAEMQSAFELAVRRPEDRLALQLRADDTVPVLPTDSRHFKCDPNGTILILGGLGGLGRWLCLKLAEHGARYIATFSRSGAASKEAKQCVEDLAQMGVKLVPYVCDVADPVAFQSAVDSMNADLPPIRGAIHSTMVLHEEYFVWMKPEQWHGSTRNKIQGGLNMHNLLPKDLDFFLLISSISAIMGNGMQGSYSTGNAFLDGLALHRRGHGLPAKVVNFGVITGVGYVAERITLDSAHMSDYMLNSIAPPEVWDVIESALTGFLHLDEEMPTQLLTCAGSGGLTKKLKHIKTLGHTADPKYRYIVRLDAYGDEDSFTKIRKGRKELAGRLEAAESMTEAYETVESAIIEKIAAAIPMPPGDVDPARPASAYGIDSLIANEIRNWAFTIVKGALTTHDILSASSIVQLSEKLTRQSSLVADKLKKSATEG